MTPPPDYFVLLGALLTMVAIVLSELQLERLHKRSMAELDTRHEAEMERARTLDALVRLQMERAIRLIGGKAR